MTYDQDQNLGAIRKLEPVWKLIVLGTGVFYILVGLLGFIPGLLSLPDDAPVLMVDAGYGYLLGLFPVNLISNLVHMAIGVSGLIASFGLALVFFQQIVTTFLAVLAILGLFPVVNSIFGIMPLFGNNIWLHFFTALFAHIAGLYLIILEEKKRGITQYES
jgi:Domain of unknown function (DUF4383)